MNDDDDGPLLEALTHRLAECPAEFLLEPKSAATPDGIDVAAIVGDHFRATGGWMPEALDLGGFRNPTSATAVNYLRLIAITMWLLRDDYFLSRPQLAKAVWSMLSSALRDLAEVVRGEEVVRDPDRREELTRIVLNALGLRPRGESEQQAADRLNTLDSAERLKVVRQTRNAEARARRIRERMAAEAAKAAAARYSPE
jgi:hypothetical protein